MSKIQTVNQLISVFKDIAKRHYQINGFGIGDNWEIGASEAKMHPVLWINPIAASMPESENVGYKTFEIDFEVRVFDLVNKDESNENDVLSDTIDTLKDIITEFKGHPYYVNSQLNIVNDIDFDPFTEEFDEEVSGWVAELSLKTPVLTSWCGLPMEEITGFEFPGNDCPDVNVLCPVFIEEIVGVDPIQVTESGTTRIISIDTSSLTGDTYTTGTTLNGNVISYNRNDTLDAYNVDLTPILTGITEGLWSGDTGTVGLVPIGSTNLTLAPNSIATGKGNIVSSGATLSAHIGGRNNIQNGNLSTSIGGVNNITDGTTSSIIGGNGNEIKSDTLSTAIIGGAGNVILSGVSNSIILGCTNLSATTSNTVYLCNVEGDNALFDSISGNTFSGGTYYGDGSNLTGIDSSNIYTSDGSLTGNRTVNLTGNTLTFSSDLDLTHSPTPINFEFGGFWQGYTRWAESGAMTVSVNSNVNPLTVYNKLNAESFNVNYNGGGFLGSKAWTVAEETTSTTKITLEGARLSHYFGNALHHKTELGGAGTAKGIRYFQLGFGSAQGYFHLGSNNRLGNADISLDGAVTTSGEFVQHASTTATVDANLINDSLSFHIDGGALAGRYKDNLGIVTDLTFPVGSGLISVNDSSGAPTFYTDLQTAIDATLDVDTIYIHSDIELTSVVTIPSRTQLTINMQGHRIWGDTTTGDFNLFDTTTNAVDRKLSIAGGGIIETIGTAVSVSAAATMSFGSNSIGEYDFGTTTIKSVNAYCFNAVGGLLTGGYLWSENSTFAFRGTIENSKFRIYESSPLNLLRVSHCEIYVVYGSWFVNTSRIFTNNVIKGTTTKSGNNGLIYGYGDSVITDNFIEMESSGTRVALYIRGSAGANDGQVQITGNQVFNRGAAYAGQFYYGSCFNNYFYAVAHEALNVGGNCKKTIGNICITESATHSALTNNADVCANNVAICLDATHTGIPLGLDSGTLEVYGNEAICSNAATSNIDVTASGMKLANNVMSETGAGINWNGNTNAMNNTPDPYGNIKIG